MITQVRQPQLIPLKVTTPGKRMIFALPIYADFISALRWFPSSFSDRNACIGIDIERLAVITLNRGGDQLTVFGLYSAINRCLLAD